MELIAKTLYMSQTDKDPSECSIFYLALKKKRILLGLWKTVTSHADKKKMVDFLSNDFDDERWQTAAMKNAFALLSKQRYQYAAAFFLLAGRLKDAVTVCWRNLGDLQLAIVICRLYEGENGPVLLEFLKNIDEEDVWLKHIILWIRNDISSSMECLFDNHGTEESALRLYSYLKDAATRGNQPWKKMAIYSLPDESKITMNIINGLIDTRCHGLAIQSIMCQSPSFSMSVPVKLLIFKVLAAYGQTILDAYDMWHSSLNHKFVVDYLYEIEKSKRELCSFFNIPLASYNEFLEKLSLERASLDPFLILLKAQKEIPKNILTTIISDLVNVKNEDLIYAFKIQCRFDELNQSSVISNLTIAFFKFYEFYSDLIRECCLSSTNQPIIAFNMISTVVLHMIYLILIKNYDQLCVFLFHFESFLDKLSYLDFIESIDLMYEMIGGKVTMVIEGLESMDDFDEEEPAQVSLENMDAIVNQFLATLILGFIVDILEKHQDILTKALGCNNIFNDR